MTRGQWTGLATALAVGIASTASAQTGQLRPDFTWERPIAANGAGPRRLAVDVALLAGANADVTDLRLFDGNGRETPYLLVFSPPVAPVWAGGDVLRVASVDTPKVRQSGFEADLGKTMTVDRFRIDAIGGQPLLKRAQLEASGDRAHWTLLAAEATLFDLPDERLRQMELSFTAGPYRYFRITWDDTNSARLPLPTAVSARVVPNTVASAAVLRAPLAVERRPSEPGRSRYRVRLPGPHLPIVALTFALGGGHVLRDVFVYEPRLAGTEAAPVLLGTGRLQRVVQARSRPHHSTSRSGRRSNHNSIWSSKTATTRRSSSRAFPQCSPNNHGSISSPPARRSSPGSARGAWLRRATTSRPYAIRCAPRSTTSRLPPGATSTQRLRRPLPLRRHRPPWPPSAPRSMCRSSLTSARCPRGIPGLVMLPLDAHVLAHSAGVPGAFGDVRVIDTTDQQVPYLVERVSEPLSLDVKIAPLTQPPPSIDLGSGRHSVYRIDWPFEHLPSPQLVIATSGRVFERTVIVAVEREPNRYHRDRWLEVLARANWAHIDKDTAAGELTLPLTWVDSKELLLVVDEGDNTPLPVTAARLLLPAYRVRFFRERNASLRLVYGNVNMTPPRYDLALLAPEVLGVAATEIAAGDAKSPPAAASLPALVSPRLFWAALVLAVAVLLGLIVRLLKREQPV